MDFIDFRLNDNDNYIVHIGELRNGLVPFRMNTGLWGFMDENANILVEPKYNSVSLETTTYICRDINGAYIIDSNGKELNKNVYKSIYPTSNPALFRVEKHIYNRFNKNVYKILNGIIDCFGNEIVKLGTYEVRAFDNYVIIESFFDIDNNKKSKENRYIYIFDLLGNVVMKFVYNKNVTVHHNIVGDILIITDMSNILGFNHERTYYNLKTKKQVFQDYKFIIPFVDPNVIDKKTNEHLRNNYAMTVIRDNLNSDLYISPLIRNLKTGEVFQKYYYLVSKTGVVTQGSINLVVKPIYIDELNKTILVENKSTKSKGLYTFSGKEYVPCIYDKIKIYGCFVKAYFKDSFDLYYDSKKVDFDYKKYKDIKFHLNENTILGVREDDKIDILYLEIDIHNKAKLINILNKTFDHVELGMNNKDYLIGINYEKCYEANNPFDIRINSVIDINSGKIVFSYPNDICNYEFASIQNFSEYGYFVGYLNNSDKKLILNLNGNIQSEIKCEYINGAEGYLIVDKLTENDFLTVDIFTEGRKKLKGLYSIGGECLLSCYYDDIVFISPNVVKITFNDDSIIYFNLLNPEKSKYNNMKWYTLVLSDYHKNKQLNSSNLYDIYVEKNQLRLKKD